MGWFDNHCHLDDERIPGGTAGALAAAREAGVTGFVTVGHRRRAQRRGHRGRRPRTTTCGRRSACTRTTRSTASTSIVALLDADRVVAVGECGLDYHYDHSPRDVQREAFAAQIALAHERDLPLVIHTREAWDDTFDVLAAEGVPERTIFHCFTGGPDEARRVPRPRRVPVASPASSRSRPPTTSERAAALCPLDRLLVETDSPYLAPVPHRGQRNQPAFVPLVGAARGRGAGG